MGRSGRIGREIHLIRCQSCGRVFDPDGIYNAQHADSQGWDVFGDGVFCPDDKPEPPKPTPILRGMNADLGNHDAGSCFAHAISGSGGPCPNQYTSDCECPDQEPEDGSA